MSAVVVSPVLLYVLSSKSSLNTWDDKSCWEDEDEPVELVFPVPPLDKLVDKSTQEGG